MDVTTDLQIKNPQVSVRIDRDRATSLGVSVQQIEQALYDAYGSRQVSTIYTPNNQYWVILELRPEYQRDPSALQLLYLRSQKGNLVPLTSVASASSDVGPLSVNHSGQLPSVTLSFNLPPGVSLGTAVNDVQKAARQALPSTISTGFSGTAQAFQSSQQGLLFLLLLAIVVIYIGRGIRRMAHALRLPHRAQHLRVRGHHHARGSRHEERDHDDRFCTRRRAGRGQVAAGGDHRGLQRAVPADHDDHDGGADGHAADRDRQRA